MEEFELEMLDCART